MILNFSLVFARFWNSKEEIIDYNDSVEPAPTEYEKVKY